MFSPITTERLTIRAMEPGDADSIYRRTDATGVSAPSSDLTSTERPHDLVTSGTAKSRPDEDEWSMAKVAESDSGGVVGDLAVKLSRQGRTAEIAYSFVPDHWNRGYATESVRALVGWLFDDVAVTRIEARVHPEDTAAAMVVERAGFLWEGDTKLTRWVGDEVSDDRIYGLVHSDWKAWTQRSTTAPDEVTLVGIDSSNESDVSGLKTHKTQEQFVAPMSRSFAHALFPEVVDGAPVVPWMRAIVADGDYAGFVMLAVSTEHHPEPYLWRFLIDRNHQRRGIGGRVLDLIVDECRQNGDTTLLTSWVEGKGSPAPFYLSHGFTPTGRIVDEETEAIKRLT